MKELPSINVAKMWLKIQSSQFTAFAMRYYSNILNICQQRMPSTLRQISCYYLQYVLVYIEKIKKLGFESNSHSGSATIYVLNSSSDMNQFSIGNALTHIMTSFLYSRPFGSEVTIENQKTKKRNRLAFYEDKY